MDKLYVLYNIIKFRLSRIYFKSRLRVYGHVGLVNKGSCSIGDHFVCTSGTMCNAMGRNIRSFIRVNPDASLEIGNEVGMSSAVIWCSNSITIGDYVKIGALVIITDTDAHSLDWSLRRSPSTDALNAKSKPIVIGNDVFIGVGSIICKGVTIGDRSIIGAGSVVTHSIPSDEVWAGNPARFIRSLNPEKQRKIEDTCF